jgi:hypothetical protein
VVPGKSPKARIIMSWNKNKEKEKNRIIERNQLKIPP